jgi:hypothetical protein
MWIGLGGLDRRVGRCRPVALASCMTPLILRFGEAGVPFHGRPGGVERPVAIAVD